MSNKNIEKQFENLLKTAEEINFDNETISDDELEKLINLLDDIKDPAQDFPSNNGQLYNEDTDESKNVNDTVLISSNPVTGVLTTIPYESSPDITEESLDELLNIKEEDFKKIEINTEVFAENVKAIFPDVSKEGINKLLNVVNKYRSGVKFSYFNELPDFAKKHINEFAINSAPVGADRNSIQRLKNILAKELFNTFITQNYSTKAFKDISKFTTNEINKAKEILGVDKSINDYNSKIRNEYEVTFLEKADELDKSDDEKDKEKAEKYRKVSRMFTQSYTYEDMYEAYKNRKIKVKNIQIDKFARTCQEFNRKYYTSNLNITDIFSTINVLNRVLDKKYDIVAIQKFIVAFINYTKFFSPNNIDEHVFMYYFINNIMILDVNISEHEVFNELIKENIYKFLDLIIEMDKNK